MTTIVNRDEFRGAGNLTNGRLADLLNLAATLGGDTGTLSTTADINTTTLDNVSGVQTLGFAASTDGGGATWVATGVNTPGLAGTTNFASGLIYDQDGLEFSIIRGVINPRQYGAVGSGAVNDSPPINNALATQNSRGGGGVYLSAGTYQCNSQLTTYDGITLYGDGVDATALTFDGATGSFPEACLWATGSSDVLPALSIAVEKDDTVITFAAAHGLVAGDLFTITDDRASSYAIGGAGNKAGEFFVVAEVPSSTTVKVETPAFATTSIAVNSTPTTYVVAECTLYKVTPASFAVRDLTIIGRADGTRVVRADFARACSFDRLALNASTQALIRLERSFDISFADVVMHDTATGGVGIQIAACQRVFLNRVRGGGSRAMFTTEPLDVVGSVVNRLIYLTDCFAPQSDDASGSVRLAANTEYVWLSSCSIAGLRIGGDHYQISNCTIWGQTSDAATGIGVGWGLYLLDMTGLDVKMDGCSITARVTLAAAAAMIV